jgi:hypothetical protein
VKFKGKNVALLWSPELGVYSGQPFLYSPLLARDRIRLLRVAAPTSDGSIAVSLEECELDSDIAYDCLSYAWDGPKYSDTGEYWTTNHQRIVCNGAVTYIRQNLYNALVQLRELDILDPIWIDALCINQDDISERNSQVAKMGEIYQRAARVIVWLGEEDENTAPALANLSRSKITVKEYTEDPKSGFRGYQDCNFTDEELLTILNFTGERRWFSRLWVVQETILARSPIFLCGAYRISM